MDSLVAEDFVRVLVVDDSSINRNIAARLLAKCPTRIADLRMAGSATEALDWCRTRVFDIVLMDINLGGILTGVDIARCLRDTTRGVLEENSRAFIVAFTTDVARDQIETYRRARMNGVLAKPFSPETLNTALRQRRRMSAPPAVLPDNLSFFVIAQSPPVSRPLLHSLSSSPAAASSAASWTADDTTYLRPTSLCTLGSRAPSPQPPSQLTSANVARARPRVGRAITAPETIITVSGISVNGATDEVPPLNLRRVDICPVSFDRSSPLMAASPSSPRSLALRSRQPSSSGSSLQIIWDDGVEEEEGSHQGEGSQEMIAEDEQPTPSPTSEQSSSAPSLFVESVASHTTTQTDVEDVDRAIPIHGRFNRQRVDAGQPNVVRDSADYAAKRLSSCTFSTSSTAPTEADSVLSHSDTAMDEDGEVLSSASSAWDDHDDVEGSADSGVLTQRALERVNLKLEEGAVDERGGCGQPASSPRPRSCYSRAQSATPVLGGQDDDVPSILDDGASVQQASIGGPAQWRSPSLPQDCSSSASPTPSPSPSPFNSPRPDEAPKASGHRLDALSRMYLASSSASIASTASAPSTGSTSRSARMSPYNLPFKRSRIKNDHRLDATHSLDSLASSSANHVRSRILKPGKSLAKRIRGTKADAR